MARLRFSLCAFLFKVSFFLAIGCIMIPAGSYGGEKGWKEPWGPFQSSAAAKEGPKESLSWAQQAAVGAIGIFRDTISSVDGDRCPSFPSCSQYGQQAIRKHGIFIGWVMTFDRLLHEADEIYMAPRVQVNGGFRAYDPIENNDFWWAKK
jgi:hypothetical protein